MYGTLKKIFAFAGSKKGLLKKSLLFSFLSGLFSAMQFAALFVVIGALVSDNRDGKFICISLGIMAVSLIGRIITTYFSTMEQTETGYCMVAEKRIHIGDRLRYIPMGYFNKNSIGNITAIVNFGRCRELSSPCPGVSAGRFFQLGCPRHRPVGI